MPYAKKYLEKRMCLLLYGTRSFVFSCSENATFREQRKLINRVNFSKNCNEKHFAFHYTLYR